MNKHGDSAQPMDVATTDTAETFGPAQQLAELLMAGDEASTLDRPARLPIDAITVMPDLFQPRGMSEKHISDLLRAIKSNGEVDPVTVITAGQRYVLIDGHHRMEAYAQADATMTIPVVYFEGSPSDAVLEAGQANSKAKLPMTSKERQNYAWRLVLLDQHSKAQIVRAAGVSAAQVANMRSVKKKLAEAALDYASWWQARTAAQGRSDDLSDDERDQWKRELADRYADGLARAFSTKMTHDPEVAAMALASYFGRRLPELVRELRAFVPNDDDDRFDDEF